MAQVEINFNDNWVKSAVFRAVRRIQYRKENTNMTGGFKVTRLEVFGGDYRPRPRADRLIVLLSDGVPTKDVDQLDAEVDAVKALGIRIYGLGISSKVRQSGPF